MSAATASAPARTRLPTWWPLAALLLLAAVLRFATLDLQSLWYDEAYTPVHVLRPSLFTTLHNVVRTENSPPLWYVLEWLWTRPFGTGEYSLRFISALSGVGTVAVCWWIGLQLAGRRAAIVLAGLIAVNPLFVWYAQEARSYGLSAFFAALAFLWFVRAEREPDGRALAWWAGATVLALLTHYFTVFLAIPEAIVLLAAPAARRAKLISVGAVALAGLALIPLILAQGGHGTQWIGRWALSSRVQAIPQYWLTGESSAPLGHGVELLVFLVVAAGAALFVTLEGPARRACLLAAGIGAAAIVLPFALALLGADYLAPRNLLAAWIPLSAALAVPLAARPAGWALAGVLGAMWLGLTLDVNASPRLQRGDWRGVAARLAPSAGQLDAVAKQVGATPNLTFWRATALSGNAIVTPQLGIAPLQYYLPPLHPGYGTVTPAEVDVIANGPLGPARRRRIVIRLTTLAGSTVSYRLTSVHGLHMLRLWPLHSFTTTAAALRRLGVASDRPQVMVTVPGGYNVPIGG